MKKIIEILNSPFVINKIAINNFTLPDSVVSIEIDIETAKNTKVKIIFDEVKDLNIDSKYYGCSVYSDIVIDDISDAQLEGLFYRVSILDDTMSFCCKEMKKV